MSLITTLIPAYKPDFLEPLFHGLRTQSFKDFQVVISDDSPGARITEQLLKEPLRGLLAGLNVLLLQGPRQGSFRNICHLLEHWGGQSRLVHLHMDDDVIYPEFYQQHVAAHLEADLGASVSQRWLCNVAGSPVAAVGLPAALERQNARRIQLDAATLFETTVPTCTNWLGEFSNMVLGSAAAARLGKARMQGLSYYGLADIGVLLDVVREQPVGFIREHLGAFRLSALQSTAQVHSHGLRCGYLAWVALALAAWREGLVDARQATQAISVTVQRCMQQYPDDALFNEFFGVVQRAVNLDHLHSHFLPFWQTLLDSSADSR